jgi:hypothetical protein
MARLKTLNTSTFVVVGDGLAAGAGDFGISEELQPLSFPAQVARRLNTPFPQPIIEGPGIGPIIGFADLPVRLPQQMQTTVLKEFPPAGLYSNVSIPGLKLIDALTRRPASPLIHRSDGLQTALNLVLGLPGLLMPGDAQLPTAIEYALFRQPTLILVALGVYDVLDAAIKGDATWMPDDGSFRANYASVVTTLGGASATVVVCTLPDPSDTAWFTPLRVRASCIEGRTGGAGATFRTERQRSPDAEWAGRSRLPGNRSHRFAAARGVGGVSRGCGAVDRAGCGAERADSRRRGRTRRARAGSARRVRPRQARWRKGRRTDIDRGLPGRPVFAERCLAWRHRARRHRQRDAAAVERGVRLIVPVD